MISVYALIYIAAFAVPAVIGLAAMILYTHLLAPAEYGVYVVGTGIAGIISAVFLTWVRQAVLRYQAGSPELDLRPEAAIAYGVSAILVACLTPLAIFVIRPHVGIGLVAASIFFSLAFSAFEISQEFRRARLDPLRLTIVSVVRSVLSLAFGYGAIAFGGGGVALLLAVGASFVLANTGTFRRGARKPLRQFSPDHLRQFVRYGVPFSLGAVAITLHYTLDRLGVAYLLGASAAGYYGLASDMTRGIVSILASSVASAMFPIAFRSYAEAGDAATRERLREGVELLFALMTPVAVWIAVSAELISGTLLGAEFQASVAAILPVLAIGRMFGSVNQYYLQISFQLAEKPFLQVAHESSILVLNLALLFPLTIAFGLFGTAASVLIAEAIGIAIGIWLSRKAFWLPFNRWGMLRVCAATAIMAAATYAAKSLAGGHGLPALAAAVAGGGVAYVALAVMLDVAGVRSVIASHLQPSLAPAE